MDTNKFDILTPELRDYATELLEAGFSIYVVERPSPRPLSFFRYSQVVEGRECFGYVQYDNLYGYSHSMPIKPSRQSGSSMFIGNSEEPDQGTAQSVDYARRVAQPRNWNHLIGWQDNYAPVRVLTYERVG